MGKPGEKVRTRGADLSYMGKRTEEKRASGSTLATACSRVPMATGAARTSDEKKKEGQLLAGSPRAKE